MYKVAFRLKKTTIYNLFWVRIFLRLPFLTNWPFFLHITKGLFAIKFKFNANECGRYDWCSIQRIFSLFKTVVCRLINFIWNEIWTVVGAAVSEPNRFMVSLTETCIYTAHSICWRHYLLEFHRTTKEFRWNAFGVYRVLRRNVANR